MSRSAVLILAPYRFIRPHPPTSLSNAWRISNDGNVGIGTTSPTASLEVGGQVKITGGNPYDGYILTSDTNGLATWEPASAGGYWSLNGNDIYNNNYSGAGNVGIGTSEPTAVLQVVGAAEIGDASNSAAASGPSSNYSIAMGEGSIASWDDIAMGDGAIADGYPYETAMGQGTIASGWDSTAMGNGTRAQGDNSTAMGEGSNAYETDSTAMGEYTHANGYASFASGGDTTANAAYSTAMGYLTYANGEHSTAIGELTSSVGTDSTAMGYTTTAQPFASLVIGQFNVVDGSPSSWVSTEAAFVIGNGEYGSPSNAFEVYKNGNIRFSDGTLQVSAGGANVSSTTTMSTLTPDLTDHNVYALTGQSGTLNIANPTSTAYLPADGEKIIFRIKDNGSAQTINWTGGQYRGVVADLPSTTAGSGKITYMGFIWNAAESTWDMIAFVQGPP